MKRFRFTIRSLLVMAALVAVAISVHRARSPIHQAIAALEARGATIEYHAGPGDWFHKLTRNYFADPEMVDMRTVRSQNEDAESIAKLRFIERLYIPHTQMNSRGVAHLGTLPRLRRLAIWESGQIHGNSARILAQCKTLEVLDIHGTMINGAELEVLTALPNLKKLIFPARFTSPEPKWLAADSMEKLVASIPELILVGDCYVRDMDDRSMRRLLDMDTSRIKRLLIRRGKFSDATWRRFNELNLIELDLQHCEISDDQLAMIDQDKIQSVEMYFSPEWEGPRVTPEGLSKYLKDEIYEVEFYQNEIKFFDEDWGTNWHRARLTTIPRPIHRDEIRRWADRGLHEIKLSHFDYTRESMEAIADVNPSIELTVVAAARHWDLLERMTRLTGLTFYIYPQWGLKRPFRFTDRHQLEHLVVGGDFHVTDNDLRQIAKLKKLDWLSLKNKNPLDESEVAILDDLKLRHLGINRQEP